MRRISIKKRASNQVGASQTLLEESKVSVSGLQNSKVEQEPIKRQSTDKSNLKTIGD